MNTTQDAAATIRGLYEAYNQRAVDVAAELYAPAVRIVNNALGTTFNGPEGFREHVNGWTTALPDSRIEVTNLIATEDWVAAEFIGRGTHTGPLVVPGATVPATGCRIEIRFCEVFRLRDGKITEQRLYFDAATMMRQLGLSS